MLSMGFCCSGGYVQSGNAAFRIPGLCIAPGLVDKKVALRVRDEQHLPAFERQRVNLCLVSPVVFLGGRVIEKPGQGGKRF